MSSVPGGPYNGPVAFDLTPLKPALYDLPPGARQRLRSEQEGLPDVVQELAQSMAGGSAAAAGIPQDVYDHFVTATDYIAQIRSKRADVEKLAEVLAESEAKHVHERENDISMMVDAAKSTARRRGDAAILASFEKTINYNAQIAEKAAKTRRSKKAEGEAESEGESQGAAPPPQGAASEPGASPPA